MRRRLQSQTQDSLDLLLDTLCNVFGGIILIACLLAMLSRPKTPATKADLFINPEAGILAQKRIEMAQAELDGLQKLRAQLQSEDDPSLLPLITELETLKKTAEKLRQEKAKQDEIATAKAKQMVHDVGNEIARLREQEQEIEKKLGIINKDTEAARQRHAALEKQLADLQLELESVHELKIEKLRFPRERLINKSAAPIIVQYGQVFPLYDGANEAVSGVRHVPAVDGSFTAFANKGAGLSPSLHAKQLRELLLQYAKGNRYLTLYVYPDSYATLRELKKLIYEVGIDYGMDLRTENSTLIFDPKGTKPAPL